MGEIASQMASLPTTLERIRATVLGMLARRLWDEFCSLRRTIWLAGGVAGGVVCLTALTAYLTGRSIETFTRDPSAVLELPFYVGGMSQAGIPLWAASAALCLFCARLVWNRTGLEETGKFLLSSGLLTSLLCLDDLYLLHEQVLPDYIGVPQTVVLAGYGVAVLAYIVRFRKTLLATDVVLFAMALFMFAGSVILDMVPTMMRELADIDPIALVETNAPAGSGKRASSLAQDLHSLAEDGMKLGGIVFWLAYFGRVGAQALGGPRKPASS